MEVSLTNPTVEKFIKELVKNGSFRSASEVVEAGVARLMLDPPAEPLDGQALAFIDEGLAQVARGEDVSFEQFAAEFRKKHLGR